jgi:hypothetical protein
MILWLKPRESRSPPGLQIHSHTKKYTTAGWSSPVARQAHNLNFDTAFASKTDLSMTYINETFGHDPASFQNEKDQRTRMRLRNMHRSA